MGFALDSECVMIELPPPPLTLLPQELSNLKRKLSLSQRMQHYQSQRGQESVDLDDALDRELSDDDIKEMLKQFREEGGRYEYSEERRNHFDIKYW